MKRVSKTSHRPLVKKGRLRIGLSLVWLFVYLILLVAGGCTQTEVEDDVILPHASKDVEALFNLNVLANQAAVTRSMMFTANGTMETDTLATGVTDTIRTRANSPLGDESQIVNLWVGQYDVVTGTRLFSQFLSSMTDNTVNVKLKQNQGGAKSHVWFVANAGDLGEVSTEKTLKERLLPYGSTETGLPDNSLCMMTGIWEGIVQEGGIKDITVNLTRLLAKITFTYRVGTDFKFTPASVVLRNAPTASQVEAPVTQLTTGVISYNSYIGTANNTGATIYWYLPENMAGTVSGDLAVDSEKKKIGTGVTNATCIELTGNAVQGGVIYKNVTFRFYPGSNYNNYDIVRNSHYTMTVMLIGIDVSDERITVGEIPPIEVDPSEMPAKKGGEKDIQITVRPGQPWVFDMPDWLFALLDGKEIPPGATITYQGPANLVFKSVEANPKVEKRETSFNIDVNGVYQEVKVTQSGSTLAKGNDISLAASVGSEGVSSFTATEGLPWLAALNSDGWMDWSAINPGFSGDEAPAGAQTLKVKASSSNPSAQARTGKIIIKAGASVGDPGYTALTQEIAVVQAGSEVKGSIVNVSAEAAGGNSSFTATPGLSWALSVANGSWVSLTGSTSGVLTTGNAQDVTFNVAVNPSSSQRSNDITVRAGDTSNGPTDKITVTQKGATLSVSAANTVAATASAVDYTSTFSATKGLSWNVSESMDWLTLIGTTNGTNNTTGSNQNIKYSVVVNPNESTRSGNITVKVGNAVNGTDVGLTRTIAVTQNPSSLSASISPTAALAATKDAAGTYTINGTNGLPYSFTAGFPSWLTVTNGTASTSGGTTTGSNQQLTYKTATVNLNASERTATVTVKAGNISKGVVVKQAGSTFTVDKTEIELDNAATSGFVIVTGTDGLPWTVSPSVQTSGITPGTTSATANGSAQTLKFSSIVNTGPAREASFTIAVTGSNHSKKVKVKQKTRLLGITVTINQSVLRGYYTQLIRNSSSWTSHPPFDADGINTAASHGITNVDLSTSPTMTGSYTIQVQKGQRSGEASYLTVQSYCSGLNEDGIGWRLPTIIELHAIYINKGTIESTAGVTPFGSQRFWSSSIYGGNVGDQCGLFFSTGNLGNFGRAGNQFVRCVRDH